MGHTDKSIFSYETSTAPIDGRGVLSGESCFRRWGILSDNVQPNLQGFTFWCVFYTLFFKVVEEMMAPFGIKRENIDGRILKSEIIWRTFQKFSAIWPYYGHHWSRHNSLVNNTDSHEQNSLLSMKIVWPSAC